MQSELKDLREHLDARLDRMEDKLDSHLERISKAEVSIEWIRGHIKLSLTILTAALAGGAGALYHFIIGK